MTHATSPRETEIPEGIGDHRFGGCTSGTCSCNPPAAAHMSCGLRASGLLRLFDLVSMLPWQRAAEVRAGVDSDTIAEYSLLYWCVMDYVIYIDIYISYS